MSQIRLSFESTRNFDPKMKSAMNYGVLLGPWSTLNRKCDGWRGGVLVYEYGKDVNKAKI